MVSDFTPDTEYVRRTFVSAQGPEERVGPGFDRWLQGILADAWEDGWNKSERLGYVGYVGSEDPEFYDNPYRKEAQ